MPGKHGILRTGRLKTAARPRTAQGMQEGRKRVLVEEKQSGQHPPRISVVVPGETNASPIVLPTDARFSSIVIRTGAGLPCVVIRTRVQRSGGTCFLYLVTAKEIVSPSEALATRILISTCPPKHPHRDTGPIRLAINPNIFAISLDNAAKETVSTWRRGWRITSACDGRRWKLALTASRIRRLILFRSTAFPTIFPAVSPTRASGHAAASPKGAGRAVAKNAMEEDCCLRLDL